MELSKAAMAAAAKLKPPRPDVEVERFHLVMLAEGAPRYRCLNMGEVGQVLSTVIDGEFRLLAPNGKEGYYLPSELVFWDRGGVGFFPPEMDFNKAEAMWELYPGAVYIHNPGQKAGLHNYALPTKHFTRESLSTVRQRVP